MVANSPASSALGVLKKAWVWFMQEMFNQPILMATKEVINDPMTLLLVPSLNVAEAKVKSARCVGFGLGSQILSLNCISS